MLLFLPVAHPVRLVISIVPRRRELRRTSVETPERPLLPTRETACSPKSFVVVVHLRRLLFVEPRSSRWRLRNSCGLRLVLRVRAVRVRPDPERPTDPLGHRCLQPAPPHG